MQLFIFIDYIALFIDWSTRGIAKLNVTWSIRIFIASEFRNPTILLSFQCHHGTIKMGFYKSKDRNWNYLTNR